MKEEVVIFKKTIITVAIVGFLGISMIPKQSWAAEVTELGIMLALIVALGEPVTVVEYTCFENGQILTRVEGPSTFFPRIAVKDIDLDLLDAEYYGNMRKKSF